MKEKSLRYEINSMYHNCSINIDNVETLPDIKSAVQLLRIYKRLFIFNQESNKGA